MAAVIPVVGAFLAKYGTTIAAGALAESSRKSYVVQKIAGRQQLKVQKANEKRAKNLAARDLIVEQEARRRGAMTQEEAVTKSPFEGKKKGNLRSQFTVGRMASGSGANY